MTPLAFVDNTVFHDYRIEIAPSGGAANIYVDDVLVATGGPSNALIQPNRIMIGDGTGSTNSRAEITAYRFVQVVSGGTPGPNGCVVPPCRLVSWWQGQENAQDRAGPNTGTPNGGLGYAPGLVGDAFNFDGVDDEVSIPVNGSHDVSTFTVEAWIKPTVPQLSGNLTLGFYGSILAKGTGVYSSSNSYAFGLRDEPSVKRLFLYARRSAILHGLEVDAPAIFDGAFHHVAGTFDGSAYNLYVDGALFATQPDPVGPGSTAGMSMLLGFDPTSGARYRGIADEISFYDRALPLAEIAAIHGAGASGKCDMVLDVEDPVTPAGSFALAVPWPNPSGSVTNVMFRLPAGAVVHAEVLDVAGRRVASLIDDQSLPAGEHRVTWDGRDAGGGAWPLGSIRSGSGRQGSRGSPRSS